MLYTLIAIFFAYLCGSISSAIVLAKLLGLPDPRTQGSGNPGATNMLRLSNKKVALATLLGDLLKGVIPVVAAKILGMNPEGLALVAFATFFGHLYPIFFHFKGGKGVATALGCLLALAWPLGLTVAITWLVIAILFRYSSLAALIAALLAPLYAWYFTLPTYTVMVTVMSLFLIGRHHRNIYNLFCGKEKKIGHK